MSAKTILVATGSHPMIPELPGKEHLISSNECFELEQLPGSIVIIGAGYIGMEFASIFAGLRRRRDRALSRRSDLARFRHAISVTGLPKRCAIAASISAWILTWPRSRRRGRAIACKLKRGDSIAAGLVMAATGRCPNTIGTRAGEGSASSSARTGGSWSTNTPESSVDNIYAVGDVTDRKNLTPVAIHDANAFAETLFNGKPHQGRLQLHPDGGVLGARDRHGRSLRGTGAREARVGGHRYLQDQLQTLALDGQRARREDGDKARGRHEDRQGARRATSSAPMRPRSCRWRRSRSGSAPPRQTSTRPWRCILRPPRSW